MSGFDSDAQDSDTHDDARDGEQASPQTPETAPADVETFLDDAPVAATPPVPPVEAAQNDEPAGPPGPGLLESCGWTVLVLGGQVFAMFAVVLVVVIGLIVSAAMSNDGKMPTQPPDLTNLSPNLFAVVSGLPAFLAYLVLIPLACWRISPAPLRKLNFSKPSLTQVLIVCSCVLPLGLLSDALYSFTQPIWEQLLDQIGFSEWKEVGLSETMKQLNGASLPLLLFFLAIVPAVGEEWMLRGLIGRGLVARWGIIPGILLTSVLFAVMHLDPPHVAAVLPIGIIMHFVYLTTRSFWMPILYHFLNNATVSVFTSLGAADIGEAAADDDSSRWLTFLAVPYLAFAMTVLWRLRTRYVASDGSELRGEYFSFEHHPEPAARRSTPNHVLAAIVFGTLLAAELSTLAVDIWSIRHDEAAPVEDIELQPALLGACRNLID